MERPIGTVIFFNKNNEILIENQVKKEKLQDLINTNLSKDSTTTFLFTFDKDLSFEVIYKIKFILKV
jgi:biopolymer transport protein ExbD